MGGDAIFGYERKNRFETSYSWYINLWINSHDSCVGYVSPVLLNIKYNRKTMKKKGLLHIEAVYTANAFRVNNRFYIGAGSETQPDVYIYDLKNGGKEFVGGCPGGVMSFVPVPQQPELFVSIMGLFPPFIGAEAGVFLHQKTGKTWKTQKAIDLPFAHRCEIITRNGKNYLFAASVSKHKNNPQDWSKKGEIHLVELGNTNELPFNSTIIENDILRNHGMIKTTIDSMETICVSGAEGIFYYDLQENTWIKKQIFDKEVSEFCFVDLDGDGTNELITIEPFHGETLNVYKKAGNKWELKFSDSLSFGHGLSGGQFNSEPIIVVGSRSGSLALDMFTVEDLASGKLVRKTIETGVGPTQTQVFSDGKTDYILSSNQKKNEVALYSI